MNLVRKIGISLALAASMLIPATTATAGGPIIGGSGSATVEAVATSCAAPNGTYTVTWVAQIDSLSRHNTPTDWVLSGQTAPTNQAIVVVKPYVRQAVLFSDVPRFNDVAIIGMARQVVTNKNKVAVPGYC